MKDREDDSGLVGKVAIISGGGAAGDGVGNGRAAAKLAAWSKNVCRMPSPRLSVC